MRYAAALLALLAVTACEPAPTFPLPGETPPKPLTCVTSGPSETVTCQ